jgi:hypothetical protein
MICQQCREQLDLHLDSEDEPELRLAILSHLAECPDCSAWYARQIRFEEHLRQELRAGSPTPALWLGVERAVRRAARPRGNRLLGRRSWFAAAVVAAGIVTALWYGFTPRRDPDALAEATVGWHEALKSSRAEPEFRSDDREAVERFIRGKVVFPVRCPPRDSAPFRLVGAGYRLLDGVPSVYLLGDCDGEPVSIFMLPGTSLDHFPHTQSHLARVGDLHGCRMGANQMVCLRTEANIIVAVGRVRSDRLVGLLEGYRHHEHHAGRCTRPVESGASARGLAARPCETHRPFKECLS